jgi:prevent-host-death family protein
MLDLMMYVRAIQMYACAMASIGVAEARKHFAEVIERAQDGPVVVERRGQAQAVVVSPAQFERMREALEELEDVAAFDAAMAEEGDSLPWEQAKADLGWV